MKTYEVINATRGSGLSAVQRIVLIHLAYRAGEDGECWASASTLAEDTALSERTVRRALDAMVLSAVLTSQPRRGRTAVYRVTGAFPPPRTESPGLQDRESGVTPDTVSGVQANPGQRVRTPRTESPTIRSLRRSPTRSQTRSIRRLSGKRWRHGT